VGRCQDSRAVDCLRTDGDFAGDLITPVQVSGVPASLSRIGTVLVSVQWGAFDVVGTLDGAIVAVAMLSGNVLDHVFDPNVEKQRPLDILPTLISHAWSALYSS
jgi:hypothetical protein